MTKKVKDVREKIKTFTKNFNYSDYQINLIVLTYLSMIMLDSKIEDLIDETLSRVYIDFTSNSIEEELKLLYHDADFSNCKNISEWRGVAESDTIDNNGKLYKGKLIVIHIFNNLVYTMDALIHELKHRINAVYTNFDGQVYMNGLSIKSRNGTVNIIIDETFNCYLTKLYLSNLWKIKVNGLLDKQLNEILKTFDLPSNYGYGYKKLTPYLVPLFQAPEIFWLFYNVALYKNDRDYWSLIELLKNYLNLAKTQDVFDFLDKLDELEFEEEEKIKAFFSSFDFLSRDSFKK